MSAPVPPEESRHDVLRTLEFVIPGEESWTVCEVRDRESGALSLMFSNRFAMRRVRSYPADWHTLDSDALWALSWLR